GSPSRDAQARGLARAEAPRGGHGAGGVAGGALADAGHGAHGVAVVREGREAVVGRRGGRAVEGRDKRAVAVHVERDDGHAAVVGGRGPREGHVAHAARGARRGLHVLGRGGEREGGRAGGVAGGALAGGVRGGHDVGEGGAVGKARVGEREGRRVGLARGGEGPVGGHAVDRVGGDAQEARGGAPGERDLARAGAHGRGRGGPREGRQEGDGERGDEEGALGEGVSGEHCYQPALGKPSR